jgi:hypothetical protein
MPRHSAVVTCKRVIRGEPITGILRDEEGSWQFLCAGNHGDGADKANDDGIALACLECVVARDLTLNEVADLGVGEGAERAVVGGEWTRYDGLDALRAEVAAHGWIAISVDAEPPYAFTIGLHETLNHPELIFMGERGENVESLLADIGERIRSGETFQGGTETLLRGHPVRFRDVANPASKRSHIPRVLAYYGGDVPLVQVVWASKDLQFPDEPTAPAGFKALQPLLP